MNSSILSASLWARLVVGLVVRRSPHIVPSSPSGLRSELLGGKDAEMPSEVGSVSFVGRQMSMGPFGSSGERAWHASHALMTTDSAAVELTGWASKASKRSGTAT